MKSLLLLAASAAALVSSGCAHSLHQHHAADGTTGTGLTPQQLQRATVVEGRSEEFIILSFSGQTDYVEKAYQNLLARCPKGQIVGTHTTFETALSFLSYTNKVIMKGYCVQ